MTRAPITKRIWLWLLINSVAAVPISLVFFAAFPALAAAFEPLTEEAAAVPAEEVAAFWQTPLADRIRRADQQGRLFREQPFILGVPLAEIDAAHAESRETVLIQGIADLYFEEEGELILVDYKTDRVAQAEVLAARYRTQLDYYRRALEQATGKIVGETYIYSTVLRQLIAI